MEQTQQVEQQMADQFSDPCDHKVELPSSAPPWKKNFSPLFKPKRRTASEPTYPLAGNDFQMTAQAATDRSCKRVMCLKAGLSQEKMDALEVDIFKPLDVCEMLLEKMKTGDYKGKTITSIHELNSMFM